MSARLTGIRIMFAGFFYGIWIIAVRSIDCWWKDNSHLIPSLKSELK